MARLTTSLHLVELLIDELEKETRTFLIAGTTAKDQLYKDAENNEEADEVLAFVKELVKNAWTLQIKENDQNWMPI